MRAIDVIEGQGERCAQVLRNGPLLEVLLWHA